LQAEEEAKIRAEKEAKEAEEKAKQEKLRKEKEVQKKQMKGLRKSLRNMCKEKDFFSNGDQDKRVQRMGEVDKLCELLEQTELEVLNEDIRKGGSSIYRFFYSR